MLLAATGLAGVVSTLLTIYLFAIFGVVVLSWLRLPPDSPLHSAFVVLRRLTDPVLEPLRRMIPPIGGVIDLSPMIVILVLSIVIGSL